MGAILQKFTVSFHVPGALAADLAILWTVPSDCTLLHVSVVGSNANDATFTLGTSAAATGYLTSQVAGDSNVPAEYDLADFDGTLVTDPGHDYPHILDGTIMAIAVVYGDVLGTAINDFTMVLTFSEG